MLRSVHQLYGDALGATDGEIGRVKDFYFGDQSWAVRYLVADTGTWLPGRQVLISPHALGTLHQGAKLLRVNLTRKQIEESPSIEAHKPVSRQYEEQYYRYFGWPFYWEGTQLWGLTGSPVLEMPRKDFPTEESGSHQGELQPGDPHLRSTRAVSGYQLKASDGMSGHVVDFMLDDETWSIARLVVKIGHRLSGKEVQIHTEQVERISYEESTVFVRLTHEAVEKSPLQPALVEVRADR